MQRRKQQRVSVKIKGFSLVEVLIAMAIGSVLLLSTARFMPSLQRTAIGQTQRQALEEEVWQRLFTVARHLQRAGFCRGECAGEGLTIEPQCVLTRWDSNLNGLWETSPAANAETTGFRLQNGVLETLRGAESCAGKGWEKMTDPNFIVMETLSIHRQNIAGFAPEFILELSAHLKTRADVRVSASFSATGHNL